MYLRRERGASSRAVLIVLLSIGVASAIVLAKGILYAIEMVKSGHGLDTYLTPWLVEFNHVGALVLFGVVFLVLVVGAVASVFAGVRSRIEWREVESNNERARNGRKA